MNGQAYQGVASLSATTSPFNQADFHIESLINKIVTLTLVKIVTVHVAGLQIGTVDVQPLVSQVDGAGQPVPHGVISGLPYIRMQAGPWAVVINPQAGDIGLCAFCMRDISKVKTTLDAALPGSGRTYDWADGVYIGMCLSAVTPTRYVQFTSTGINITSPDTVTVTANKVDLISNNVNLGAEGGQPVARVGDTVAGGVITSGSANVRAA